MHVPKPTKLNEFIGQDILKRQLAIEIKAALIQRRATRPMLFSGPGGLGKTSLAQIIHSEMGNEGKPHIITGREVNQETLTELLDLQSPGYDCYGNIVDFAAIKLPIVIVDECESVPLQWLEVLHPLLACDDRVFWARKGNQTKRVWTIRMGFIFITNYLGKMVKNSEATVSRFGIRHQFNWYDESEIVQVINAYALRAKVGITPGAVKMIASRSNGVPREAENLFDRAWSYAIAANISAINETVVSQMLSDVIGDNEAGLSREMVTYLKTLNGSPTGRMSLQSLAGVLGCDDTTLTVIIEPPLIKRGYIARVSNGRQITYEGQQAISGQSADPQSFFKRNTNLQGRILP